MSNQKAKNALSLLLNSNKDVSELPKKKIEIERLSKLLGQPFIVEIRAITNKEFKGIQNLSVCMDNPDNFDIDDDLIKRLTVLDGVTDPNLKSKELREKYDAPTPMEVIDKLLLPGEYHQIYNEITELSGFGKDSVKDVKNS